VSTRGVTFRAAENADTDAILDLWVAAWRDTVPDIDFEARRGWFARHWRQMLADGGLFLVAERQGKIIGLLLFDAREGYLDQISVEPACRGQGLAQALMAEAKRCMPQGFHLWVNDDNARAIAFYRKEGFRPGATGTNPNSGKPVTRYGWRPN
jgi:putative acetyltransferase